MNNLIVLALFSLQTVTFSPVLGSPISQTKCGDCQGSPSVLDGQIIVASSEMEEPNGLALESDDGGFYSGPTTSSNIVRETQTTSSSVVAPSLVLTMLTSLTPVSDAENGGYTATRTMSTEEPHSAKSPSSNTELIIFIVLIFVALTLLCIALILLLLIRKYRAKNRRNLRV